MICRNCGQKADSQKTVIHQGKLLEGCEACLQEQQQGHSGAAKYSRDMQRIDYRKDLIQPNEPRSFVKAYGADAARDRGYSEEQIRKYS